MRAHLLELDGDANSCLGGVNARGLELAVMMGDPDDPWVARTLAVPHVQRVLRPATARFPFGAELDVGAGASLTPIRVAGSRGMLLFRAHGTTLLLLGDMGLAEQRRLLARCNGPTACPALSADIVAHSDPCRRGLSTELVARIDPSHVVLGDDRCLESLHPPDGVEVVAPTGPDIQSLDL